MRNIVVVLVLLTAPAVASCAEEADAAAFDTVRSAELTPGAALPDVAEPVIVVDGPGGDVASDMDTLERLGTVKATVCERWFNRDVTFEGPWISDVLNIADVSGQGRVQLHALDDFEVSFDRSDLRAGDALLAIRADGAPIPVADGGPARLVFLDDTTEIGADEQNWIWNLDAIHLG